MRSKTNFWKRSLAAFLSFVMLLGMVPALGGNVAVEADAAAATDETNSYITMPITIRDFAADGMLFEFNQTGATGDALSGEGATQAAGVPNAIYRDRYNVTNPTVTEYQAGFYTFSVNTSNNWQAQASSANDAQYFTFANSQPIENVRYLAFSYRITAKISGSTPTIQFPTGKAVSLTADNAWHNVVLDLGTAGYNWYIKITPCLAKNAYIRIQYMAGFATKADAQTFIDNGGKATEAVGTVYHQGDTAGFSMLQTTNADYINNLTDSDDIAGTTLFTNGAWGDTTEPKPVTATLNSGATQKVYGALIRTDLVEATLDKDGKPVYTEAAVSYIADYMDQIFDVPYQDDNGALSTYYVMGVKMFDSDKNYVGPNADTAVYDLADIFRGSISSLGTYADAKAKFEAGNLTLPTQATTWFEAAYYLLHYTWRDSTADATQIGSDGYGMPIDNYESLRLVQTTNEDGEVCYVFNSKYDDTVYDPYNGEIYNTQTSTYTIAENDEGDKTYVRGNPLPENRFDPLGWSGAGLDQGYGMSGDVYGDMVADSTADWCEFYDNTNYNLSLEGHAEFIYYEDDNLYFTFTGDDDVYLYVNGVRILDMGAAHSISKVKINLNDVAEMCGLYDGQAYKFDFFYMERHGTAANFAIETNIKIVDPSMTTAKEGFQNMVSTGYNGYVDPLTPVYYSFSLQNDGEAPIENLTFEDEDIGVYLSKDTITLNDETQANRQYVGAIVYNADGSTKSHTDNISDDELKALLDTGLEVGEQIIVYGFRYTIPEALWEAGNGTFTNTVYTTAVGVGANAGEQLNGIAEWKVQQREYSFKDYHVYEWVGHSVTLTKDELLKPLVDAVPGFDETAATIAVSSASGTTTGVNVNTKAVLNSDGSITYTGTQTGADTFYYKVTQGTVTAVIGVAVYSYDVVDNTYVLDYGLAVELNGNDFGFRVNDTLELATNPHATTYTVTPDVENATSKYGTFTWDTSYDPDSLKYTPNAIIDNIDTIDVGVQVLEAGATELTKFTGVEMYETITTAPANVVYYEENFPGITYVNSGENEWAHYETVDEDGNSVAGTEQSADQDSNYGSDPNYETDKVGTIVSGDSVGTVVDSMTLNLDTSDLDALQASGIEYLNEYLGLGGSDSNGTVNELVVKTTAEVMFFEFTGTGFEIVGRTTDNEYAVINVQVQKANDDGTYTVVAQKPVITESIGGDLYQVPIISITGLERAEYRVVVKAAASTATKTRVLYIDGIRIYGPLSDDQALEYYNPEEYQAEFFEIKQMIENGQMIYADATDTEGTELVTGTTLVESSDPDEGVLTSIESVDDYMTIGPNNELYLDGNAATGIIAFFLTPDADYPDAARTLEIGAHRKSDSSIEDNGYVHMVYSSTAEGVMDAADGDANFYTISSGTEMYYTIDVDNLTLDENGRYLVMIGTNGSESYGTTLALTNIKVAGYTISFAEAAILTADAEGDLFSTPIVAQPFALLNARMAAVEEEPEVEQIPVNENLTITSASLKAAKVVSGKVATLTVKAGADAETIVVTDADGNVMEATRCVRKVSGDVATFTFIWEVTGSRGDALDFSVRVYDAEGLASVNAETVTVTIK